MDLRIFSGPSTRAFCLQSLDMQTALRLDIDHWESLLSLVSEWLPHSLVVYHWLKIAYTRMAPLLDGSACYVDRWPNATRICCLDSVIYESLPRSYFLSFAMNDKTDETGFMDFLRSIDSVITNDTHAVCTLSLPSIFANIYCGYFREKNYSVKYYENDAYWVPPQLHTSLATMSVQSPFGYYFDTLRMDEAQYVDEMWPHRWIGSLPLNIRKIRYMPNVCLRNWENDELCSFEIMHSEFGLLNHLFTRPQYRRLGLARVVEFRQMQKALEVDFIPYKYVVCENEPPNKLTDQIQFWQKYGQYPFVEIFTREGMKLMESNKSQRG